MKKLIAYIIVKLIIFLSLMSIVTGSFDELSEQFEKYMKYYDIKNPIKPDNECPKCGAEMLSMPSTLTGKSDYHCHVCKETYCV